MAYSLQSRDLIADGIETMMASQFYDANAVTKRSLCPAVVRVRVRVRAGLGNPNPNPNPSQVAVPRRD